MKRIVLITLLVLSAGVAPLTAQAQQTLQAGGPCPTGNLIATLFPGQLCNRADGTSSAGLYLWSGSAWGLLLTLTNVSQQSITWPTLISTSYVAAGGAPALGANAGDYVFNASLATNIPPGSNAVILKMRPRGSGICELVWVGGSQTADWPTGIKGPC